MIETFLHGNMSLQQENMEDLWTSCVFGSLKSLPPSDGILPFLAQPRSWKDETADLAAINRLTTVDRSEVDYQFWPTLEHHWDASVRTRCAHPNTDHQATLLGGSEAPVRQVIASR